MHGYHLKNVIGEGAFGVVHRAVDPTSNKEIAIKTTKYVKLYVRETSILTKLRQGNVISLLFTEEEAGTPTCFGYFTTSTLYTFGMPLATTTLDKLTICRGAFSCSVATGLLMQLLAAVSYCHEQDVFHRDIKPQNVLVSPGLQLLLSDFGIATTHRFSRGRCGTPDYVAPEVQLSHRHLYDTAKSDVWSCGVCFFNMLTVNQPFTLKNSCDPYYRAVRDGSWNAFWDLVECDVCSKLVIDSKSKRLVEKMLTFNPFDRPLAQELYSETDLATEEVVKELRSRLEVVKNQN